MWKNTELCYEDYKNYALTTNKVLPKLQLNIIISWNKLDYNSYFKRLEFGPAIMIILPVCRFKYISFRRLYNGTALRRSHADGF